MLKFCVVAVALMLSSSIALGADAPATTKPSQNVGGIENAKDAGTVKGVVYFTGDKPEIKPVADIAGNAYCKAHHDTTPMQDKFLFGKNGGNDTLQNVLVYVSKGFEGKEFEPTAKPVLLDQIGCMYTPHVVAVMVGQELDVRNSDDTLHNVMSTPRDNEPFNFGQPVAGQINKLTFDAPESKMNTKCFMHPWMSACIHVLEHPFFAVTGEDGTFEIKGLPAGEYELSVLHEASMLGATPEKATIKIAAGETKTQEFTYQIKKDE